MDKTYGIYNRCAKKFQFGIKEPSKRKAIKRLFDKIGNLLGITSAGIPSLDNVGYAIKVSYLNNLIDVCPEPLQIPTSNKLQSLSFTEKIKDISQYVVIIKIY